MEYGVQVKVATISMWNYFALILNIVGFAILYMKANKTKSLKLFLLIQSAMFIWLVGKIFKTVSPNADLRWAFIVVYYFGICLLEVSFFDFAYLYNKGKTLAKPLRILIYMIGLSQFILVLTNPYHFKFYRYYGFWGDDFGPAFYVHLVLNYTFIIWGMVLCSKKFGQQVTFKIKYHRHIISAAIIFPIVFNMIYITGVLKKFCHMLGIQVFDITPIIFTWSLLLFIYVTFKYEFLDLNPLLKHEITNNLETPILIMNEAYKVYYKNESFDKLDFRTYDKISESVGEIMTINDGYYACNMKVVESRFNHYKIFTLTDVTSYNTIKRALDQTKNQLDENNLRLKKQIEYIKKSSHTGAKNLVARELHDVVGHSLVVSMKLLEVAKLTYKYDLEKTVTCLEKSKNVLKTSYEEMENLLTKEKVSTYTKQALNRDLGQVINRAELSGIKIKYFFKGQGHVNDDLYVNIKNIVKELITNTLKHSNASQILLSVNAQQEFNVTYMDNGVGKKAFIAGNGLKGMQERINAFSGQMTYELSETDGFNCSIILKAS